MIETLDELTEMTVRLFSLIENKGADPSPSFSPHPYGDAERGSIVFIKALAEISHVNIIFPIPHQEPHFRTEPTYYIRHAIKHRGVGSLYSHFQKNGLGHSVHARVDSLGGENQVIDIRVELTPAGLREQALLIIRVVP